MHDGFGRHIRIALAHQNGFGRHEVEACVGSPCGKLQIFCVAGTMVELPSRVGILMI